MITNFKLKNLWIIIICLAVILWFIRNEFLPLPDKRLDPESLDFNLPLDEYIHKPVIISADEKINIEVFEKVHKTVVNIATTTLGLNFWMEIIPKQGQGTGFIIDHRGYILTNNHVVAKAQKITVTMADGRKVSAILVGRDQASDLAVIKIPPDYVEDTSIMGDSDILKEGQKAIAIGNPFGLSHTLTTGVVSALNRSIRDEAGNQIDDLIQTDAAINPGNSGGPLLNSSSEVIGINTAIFSLSGGYQGIGFAIPINRAKQVATQLITSDSIARPWLGITGIPVSPELSRRLALGGTKQGILVVDVIRGAPAYESGLRGGHQEIILNGQRLRIGGDIILALNNHIVLNMQDLTLQINREKVGNSVNIQILRQGIPVEVSVVLTEKP